MRYGTLLRTMPGPEPAQSYVVGSLLRRIEESFARAGRLRREWNGRSAGAAGAGWQANCTVVGANASASASGKVQLQ